MLCPSCQTSQPLSFRCKDCGVEMMRGNYREAAGDLEPAPTPSLGGGADVITAIQPMPLPATGTALDNPYASPGAVSAPRKTTSARGVIASRSARLAAVMIDYVCGLLVTVPVLSSAILVVASEQRAFGELGVAATLAGLFVLGIVQASYLVREGQTIGKKLLKIRIVDHVDGEIPHWSRVLAMRYVLNTALRQIPLYAFVDVLFIFGVEQRCVHDYLAGTKVIEI